MTILVKFQIEIRFSIELHGNSKLSMTSCPPSSGFVVLEEKVKGQFFGSTGVKQVKMIQFCWQWSQNVHLVNTMKN